MIRPLGQSNDCFWRHRWGKWNTEKEGAIAIKDRTIGFWLLQKRTCEKCGKVELDHQEKM